MLMQQRCRAHVQMSLIEPPEGDEGTPTLFFSKMVEGNVLQVLTPHTRLGAALWYPITSQHLFFFPPPPFKRKKKDKHIIIQPQFEKSGHWHPLVKLRLKTYPRMRDLPKICQPLQCSNCWYDHSHMKNEIKPHGNLWHFYYYAMFGWKKKWRNSPSLSRASLEKLFLTFLNYTFHH